MSEVALITLTGGLHQYLDTRWVSMGSVRVGIYHRGSTNLFRIVARKIENSEVGVNTAITKLFRYQISRPSFHQFRDTYHDVVYGITFNSPEDANAFAETIAQVVETVSKEDLESVGRSQQQPQQQQEPRSNSTSNLVMTEMQEKLAKQRAKIENILKDPPADGGEKEDIYQQLKQDILNDFRSELEYFKRDLIETLKKDLFSKS